MDTERLRRLSGRLLRLLVWFAILLALLLLALAFESRKQPDLRRWHRLPLQNEAVARDMREAYDWSQYLRAEETVFRELSQGMHGADLRGGYRYDPALRLGAQPGGRDWNRSQQHFPAQARGAVLLLHGLTDSPYSLRHIAALYERAGYAVIVPRLPGHGTVPAGLLGVQWQDWRAVVRVAARELRARVGPDRPFHVVGYSNGAALALQYAMDAAESDEASLPRPDRLVLLSPMIGIGRTAAVSRLLPLYGSIPYFEKSLWLEVQPEFNPYKYNSFPVNGVVQSHLLTSLIQAQLLRLQGSGAAGKLPPILAFQSVLDSTVSTRDVVDRLFAHWPAKGSELVLFDINRASLLAPMLSHSASGFAASLPGEGPHAYRLTWIVNRTPGSLDVDERSVAAGESAARVRRLGLAFPGSVYSLSHVALPFPMHDSLYGLQPHADADSGIHLGTIALHGERGALVVGADQLMRLNYNPFYPYLEARIAESLPGAQASDVVFAGEAFSRTP
ncbi:alpha/beta hydrolase [Arenimonas sp.]|uniref:alpha/beta hydrolase n=1 Tax=Arenimonas sp. TaxID=1872635 RepID=UPI0039E40275